MHLPASAHCGTSYVLRDGLHTIQDYGFAVTDSAQRTLVRKLGDATWFEYSPDNGWQLYREARPEAD